MSWPYGGSSGAFPYLYYYPYGYNYSGYNNAPTSGATDSSSDSVQNPPPPGLASDGSTAPVAPTSPPSVAQPSNVPCSVYTVPRYPASQYGNDPALDAAQRWNAMNCSYWGYQSPVNMGVGVSATPYFATSGPRFPGQSGLNSPGSNTLNFQQTPNGTPYSVYPGPKPQSPSTPVVNKPKTLSDSAGGESRWSPELKDYVHRSFCSADTPIEKDQMERILREKLEYVFRNKIVVDWSKEPIPVIPSKSLAAIQAAANNSSINVVRPVSLQPRRPRGRLSGHLPTGTLARNQLTSGLSVKSEVLAKPTHAVSSLSSNSRTTDSEALKTTEPSKRKRPSVDRSRSLSSSSSSPNRNDVRHQKRGDKRKWQQSSTRRSCKGRKLRRMPSTDNDHLANDRANTDESDTTTLSSSQGGSPKCQRDGNKKRSGWDRRKSSTNNSSPSNPTPSATSRGGRRGASNAARGRGDKSATNARWAAPETTQHRLSQRADRFKDHLGAGSIAKSTSQLSLLASVDDTDLMSEQLEQFSIVGTMQELEKPYLRLTTAPDPANVRPPEVLEKALVHVKQRWKERGDYLWVCEQLKSIRQDLTVQRVQTEMTAEVYEAHAVIALEAGDSQEFHQCQSQLSLLHAEGFGSTRRLEFTAYRLLYYIFTQDYLGISTLLASLKSAQKANPYIRFALQVREAWALHNYKRFFHLVCSSDAVALLETEEGQLRGCRQVLAWSLDRERKKALKTILKAYRPTLSLDFITEILGFESLKSCAEFMTQELGVPVTSVESVEKLDCKMIWSQLCKSGVAAADNH
uniref:SAC3_GANP domain-containing protein n=1 Tax=Mesocestoides corti TaxID=53468 RepID=A0A5K3ER45_MESCO